MLALTEGEKELHPGVSRLAFGRRATPGSLRWWSEKRRAPPQASAFQRGDSGQGLALHPFQESAAGG